MNRVAIIRHVFPRTGPNANPIYVEVNGRKGRRAVCVMYGNALRYDVLDMDAVIEAERVKSETE